MVKQEKETRDRESATKFVDQIPAPLAILPPASTRTRSNQSKIQVG